MLTVLSDICADGSTFVFDYPDERSFDLISEEDVRRIYLDE